jgi:anaerobic selenocysteine-containing dehydrogenase
MVIHPSPAFLKFHLHNPGGAQIMHKSEMQVFQTVCGICNGSCGINVFVRKDRIIRIEGRDDHPISRGYLCPKGKAIKELIEARDRLRRPLKKTAWGKWLEISWDEAFDAICCSLKEIKGKYGAEAVAVHVGQAGVSKEYTQYAARFCQVFGSPNFSTAGSHCHISKLMANKVTYGALPVPDYSNSNCIVLWAYNPLHSCPPLMSTINEALQGGARLIVVDPRATSLAKRADCHLRLRPGTDGALALGMLNVVIRGNLYDKDFVDKWTIGFDRLVSHIADYPPEKVEQITWVPAEKIEEAARLYARSLPACLYPGIAVELHTNGFQAVRAISILQAITGNLDVAGGSLFIPEIKLAPVRLEKEYYNGKPAVGQQEFPLFHKFTGHAQANIYSTAILEGKPYPLKGMIVAGSNPILSWPDAGKLKCALAGLKFLVVVDHFMTETARQADIVLPAATFLSTNEFWNSDRVFGVPRLGLAGKVFDDNGIISNWQFWNELARRMDYKDFFPWLNEEDAINFRLKPLGLSVDDLRKNPSGHVLDAWVEKKYEREGFDTPSGKVEIYSKELENLGYDPLPAFVEPHESPVSSKVLAGDYPLLLTTGARTIGYMHSRFHNIPSTRRLFPEPVVDVHRDKALELGLEEGEEVIVESPRGSIELKVKLTDGIQPEVIFISHGWEEANANVLTANEVLDPVTGFPGDRSLLASIRKKYKQVLFSPLKK